jgi:mannose-6-phosphate isomerase-like protein (cupin superfamily)
MERLKVGSDEITLHVSSGTLLAAEVTLPAGGGPPGLHRHASEELYRVEAGELAIYLEGERLVAGPGRAPHPEPRCTHRAQRVRS